MLDFENSGNIEGEKKNKIFEWEKYADIYFIGTEKTAGISESLVEKGIKKKDAVHIACAIESGCDYFITTDRGILKKNTLIADLKIINPLEYIIESGEENEK